MLPPDVPDLTTLDLLDAVAELGSLGQAASRHMVTQPAVSMRMSALERRLGLTLLERRPSGTCLTVAGERVVTSGRRVLAEVHALMAEVDALRAAGSSLLRVAASLTVADHLLPAWIGIVHQEVPGVSLTLEVTNSRRVLASVAARRVDIGFVEGNEADRPGLHREVIRTDRLVVVVGPRHPWARRGKPVSAGELARTDLIVREKGSGTRQVLDDALAPWGGVRTRLELGSASAIIGAARHGDSPAVLSALAVEDDCAAGRLVAVATEGVDLTRSLRAVWLADQSLPALAGRLLIAARVSQAVEVGSGPSQNPRRRN